MMKYRLEVLADLIVHDQPFVISCILKEVSVNDVKPGIQLAVFQKLCVSSFLLQVSRNVFPRIEHLSILETSY